MVHIHTHTAEGSLLDATTRAKELPKRAIELNMPAVAITEHGTLYSAIDFYTSCKENNVKPIIGCEFYVCDNMSEHNPDDRYDHLIVLAKNNQGYKNLLRLVSLGFIKGFYFKPRIDFHALQEHKDGLIVTSACLGGQIQKAILREKSEEYIKSIIMHYKDVFKDDFYLEIQAATSDEQKKINQVFAVYSDLYKVPLVVTSDVHFLKKEDYESHGIFIQTNQDRTFEGYKDCWFKSEEEIFEVIEKHIGWELAIEAIANTHRIADKCNIEIELGKSYLPDYPIPAGFKDDVDYFRHLINVGFYKRKLNELPLNDLEVYQDRLKEEFDIITKKNYTGYFLIVQDFLEECRKENIYLGDGRGSADNSLICFVLGITNVDPIKYQLNFSRFLTMERTELPDIDMDIQSSRKPDAIAILKRKYGDDKVAQISTFQSMQANATLDKIGKVLGIPYATITEIKKYLPQGVSLEAASQKSSKLAMYKEQYPQLFEYALKLEGLPTAISIHAGGIVIAPSDRDITEFTALGLGADDEVITHFEMHNIEQVGLVKMDCLATITLDVIDNSLELIYGEQV